MSLSASGCLFDPRLQFKGFALSATSKMIRGRKTGGHFCADGDRREGQDRDAKNLTDVPANKPMPLYLDNKISRTFCRGVQRNPIFNNK
ncbi:hypothetical protein BaRGS_00008788 [Batillaria attramentaria]|uniref:Uncharacterized protein n=1 Tax=Batillaria attramentaria TaxID=370345 RepID=A0ABD0LK91_9CAEN